MVVIIFVIQDINQSMLIKMNEIYMYHEKNMLLMKTVPFLITSFIVGNNKI